MVIREEIKEAIKNLHEGDCIYPDGSYPCPKSLDCVECFLKYLDSKDVVIKAEDQTVQVTLPADGKPTGLKVPYHLSNLGENIAAVERLIEWQT